MAGHNKNIGLLLLGLVVVVAILSSFGLAFFNGGTPEIVLPVLSGDDLSGKDDNTLDGLDFVQVAVTPATVQNVIAGLERWPSYTRTITMAVTYGEGQVGIFKADVWVDRGWTRVEMTPPVATMGTQYTIVGDGTLYRWYGNDPAVVQWPADEKAPDLAQHIPTYTDVLDLDSDTITDATYVEKDGMACIYVETAVDELGYLERYWVAVDNGLLIASETVQDDKVVLSMTSSAITGLAVGEADFTLPNGTRMGLPG